MSYAFLVIVTLIIGCAVTWDVNHQLKKYASVPISNGMTGAQAANTMLHHYGIYNVSVRMGSEGQDHFDPRDNSISLSPSVYNGRSITAAATACHEAGHACQYAQNYVPMKVRGALVPVASLASNAWIFLLIAGIFFAWNNLIIAAIVLYACVVLFELVTLPVEFNASNRAKSYMQLAGYQTPDISGSSAVLRSCAMTYVAAALTSILQLLWLLGQNRD
jgi:uncharacterized protein